MLQPRNKKFFCPDKNESSLLETVVEIQEQGSTCSNPARLYSRDKRIPEFGQKAPTTLDECSRTSRAEVPTKKQLWAWANAPSIPVSVERAAIHRCATMAWSEGAA